MTTTDAVTCAQKAPQFIAARLPNRLEGPIGGPPPTGFRDVPTSVSAATVDRTALGAIRPDVIRMPVERFAGVVTADGEATEATAAGIATAASSAARSTGCSSAHRPRSRTGPPARK